MIHPLTVMFRIRYTGLHNTSYKHKDSEAVKYDILVLYFTGLIVHYNLYERNWKSLCSVVLIIGKMITVFNWYTYWQCFI